MLKTLLKVAAISSLLFVGTMAKAADPIRIPVLNWSSQIVMANVMAQVFEEMGHTVELVPAESASRYKLSELATFTWLMQLGNQQWRSHFMKQWTKAA